MSDDVVPFTAAMVETYLHDRGIEHAEHEDGVFVFGFSDAGLGQNVVHIAADEHRQILEVRVSWSGFSTPQQDRFQILCGEWNELRFWPKTYTHVEDGGLLVVAEGALPILGVGIHQELLDCFCDTTIETGMAFFRWFVGQNRLHEMCLADLFDAPSDDR